MARRAFTGKVAIVTGGASGIGRALCQELGRHGAFVVAADVNDPGAERTATMVTAGGGAATAVHLDVTDAAGVEALVAEVAREHGRLDLMVNNAGIFVLGETHDMTLEDWRRMVDVNLLGVVYGTTAAYRQMHRQGFGHIVNVASLAGLIPIPLSVAYAATKHAVMGLSTSLRVEAAAAGVRVSVVCPGNVRTEIHGRFTMLGGDREAFLRRIPFLMDPARAARRIVTGIRRNRPIIVFQLHTRLAWWLVRIHPGLLSLPGRALLRGLRTLLAERPTG